jgi:hypothetical protein
MLHGGLVYNKSIHLVLQQQKIQHLKAKVHKRSNFKHFRDPETNVRRGAERRSEKSLKSGEKTGYDLPSGFSDRLRLLNEVT